MDTAGLRWEIIRFLKARRNIHRQTSDGPRKLDLQPARLRPATEATRHLRQFLVNKRADQSFAVEDGDATAAERARTWFADFEGHLRRLAEDYLQIVAPGAPFRFDVVAMDGGKIMHHRNAF